MRRRYSPQDGAFRAWMRAGCQLCATALILGAWLVGECLVDVFGAETGGA